MDRSSNPAPVVAALCFSVCLLLPSCGTTPDEGAPPKPAVEERVRQAPAATADEPEPTAPEPVGITIAEAAERIQIVGRGLIVFFSVESKRSQQLFPELVRFGVEYEGKVPLLAFSTDQEPEALATFLDEQGAPFEVEQVRPWKAGALREALEPTGITFSEEVPLPWVAVVAENGDVLGRWQGIGTLKPAAKLFEEP